MPKTKKHILENEQKKQPVLLWPQMMSISKNGLYGFDNCFIDLRYESLVHFDCFFF